MSQIETENDKKNQRFPIFQDFMHFFKFSTDFVDWNIEKGQQEKLCCPVDFSEELIAFLKMKIIQIDTENDKKINVFRFSKILCNF